MTDTFSLKLLYGIPPAVGDPLSAEQGMEVIALASEVMRPAGFFMDEERPFFPQIAGLKNGGAWLDNPAEDGRHLQSEAKGNIVETIYVKLAGDVTQRYHYLSALSRFADEARRFHSTDYQTRPVQIEWWASGAPGAQWALVYNIDYAVQRAHSDAGTVFDVVITVEREPAWRGVMFGLPATVWTQYALGNDPGSDYTYADLSLVDGTALYQETVHNKHEFNGAVGYDADTPPLTKNWIDIDAADIPGDAPALVSISSGFDLDNGEGGDGPRELYIARSTKPRRWVTDQGNEDRPQFYNLNGGDASQHSQKTLGNATTGVISNGSSVNHYYWLQTAAISLQFLTWGIGTGVDQPLYALSREAFRGHFAVFVRGRTDVTTPASFEFRVGYGIASNQVIPPYTPAPATNSDFLFYIGAFSLPPNDRSWVGDDGDGLTVPNMTPANTDLQLRLLVTTATATQTTRVIDVVLLPFDEAQLLIFNTIGTTTAARITYTGRHLYDNTGYVSRLNRDTARILDAQDLLDPELRGSEITLDPKKDNRLYFLFTSAQQSAQALGQARQYETLDVRVNIVPRWYGIRDK